MFGGVKLDLEHFLQGIILLSVLILLMLLVTYVIGLVKELVKKMTYLGRFIVSRYIQTVESIYIVSKLIYRASR